jgi:multiple sugar transport system ATP-binding protein
MMGGHLLQVAPPETLYRDPQDLRVAEMIGSPKINVVSRAHWAALGGAEPGGLHAETTQLAFRPEDAAIAGPGAGTLGGSLARIENLGSDLYLNVTLAHDAGAIVVRTPPDAPRARAGDQVCVRVEHARLMQFDRQGRRLAAIARVAA